MLIRVISYARHRQANALNIRTTRHTLASGCCSTKHILSWMKITTCE